MSGLSAVPAARIGGAGISLHSVLYELKITDRLGDLPNAVEDQLIHQAAEREGCTPGDAELHPKPMHCGPHWACAVPR